MKVLACLFAEEPRPQEALAAAARLAEELAAPLCLVRVYPPAGEAVSLEPSAWQLRTEDPAPALRNFIRLQRVTHVVLGEAAGRRWGEDLSGPFECKAVR